MATLDPLNVVTCSVG